MLPRGQYAVSVLLLSNSLAQIETWKSVTSLGVLETDMDVAGESTNTRYCG